MSYLTPAALLHRLWKRSGQTALALASNIRVWLLWLIVSVCTAVILFCLFSSYFTVQSIRVLRKDARTDIEQVQKILRPYFKRHIFFLSSPLIEKDIRDAISEVESVSIAKKLPNELIVTVLMEDISAAIYIGSPEETEADFVLPEEIESYHYLSEGGVYLQYPFSVPIKKSEAFPPLHIVDWAVKPVHGQNLLDPESMESIRTTVSIIRNSFGHAVTHVTYYVRAREYHLQTERLSLWFDTASSAVDQIERYRLFLQTVSEEEDIEHYVDLRLHDKVVYQ